MGRCTSSLHGSVGLHRVPRAMTAASWCDGHGGADTMSDDGTETVTISNRTWTSHPASPQVTRLRWHGPSSAARGADVPESGVRSRAEAPARGAQREAIQAAGMHRGEPAGPW